MSSFLVGTNIVPPRPKDQARYTIRELLILGLTLPIRFCPINKFGPEALALDIVSLERMSESLLQYEREQMRQWQIAHIQAKRRLITAAKERAKREGRESARVFPWVLEDKADGRRRRRGEMKLMKTWTGTGIGLWYII
jgi:hypothetical protein